MHFDAANWRVEQERNERIGLAWHMAAFQRARKLPPLDTLLSKKSRRPKRQQGQSWQEQRNVARMLTVLYGGQVIQKAPDGS